MLKEIRVPVPNKEVRVLTLDICTTLQEVPYGESA